MLTTYDPAELRRRARRDRERERAERQAEQRAAADAARADFVLTGSPHPTDELEARGQRRLF